MALSIGPGAPFDACNCRQSSQRWLPRIFAILQWFSEHHSFAWIHHKYSVFSILLHYVASLPSKARDTARNDILNEKRLKFQHSGDRNPASGLPGSFRLLRHFEINGFRHFPRMLIAFFNTSRASWASRSSRLRRAISFCSSNKNIARFPEFFSPLGQRAISDTEVFCTPS